MRILGLIPARGGSKGVAGKNIKLLAGKPLIEYTVEQANAATQLDRLILSTDDEVIAATAREIGLEVPFMRPDALANDSASSLAVVQHSLDFFESLGEVFDAVCLLQVTSPYRPAGVIDDAIDLFKRCKPDSLVSVRKVPDEFNPHWTFEISGDDRLQIATGDEVIISRRQDLPDAYHRDGAIYITSVDTIRNKGSLLGDDIVAFPIDSPMLINIDTMDDWNAAVEFYEDMAG